MKRRTLFVLGALVTVAAAGAFAAARARDGKKDDGVKTVAVARGELVDKALAVGTIEPRVEVSVKSILAGVVRRRYVEVGEFVRKGQPLLEIAPNPTPLEMVELRRGIEMREIEVENLEKEAERQKELRAQDLISQSDYDMTVRRAAEGRTQLALARERLALQEGGKVSTGGREVETVIRAPIDGFVLEDSVEIGDPVVPLTPYQEGTVLMRMAAMRDLIFRGTVDEIDVGRLKEGMPVAIKVGALPDAKVTGRLDRIWLKARKQEQATVFPIEIVLTDVQGATLRAGYSANAEVIIAKREGALYVPERLLARRGDSTFVTVRKADGTSEERAITTGLSDAISIEVLAGLAEGEQVLEPAPREIQ